MKEFKHFNQLSEKELEALALLSEELGEAQHAIGKILRHGLESRWPKPDGPTNRGTLEKEIAHVFLAAAILIELGIVEETRVDAHMDRKCADIGKYLHHITAEKKGGKLLAVGKDRNCLTCEWRCDSESRIGTWTCAALDNSANIASPIENCSDWKMEESNNEA